MAASMPMITMTMTSSTSEKPDFRTNGRFTHSLRRATATISAEDKPASNASAATGKQANRACRCSRIRQQSSDPRSEAAAGRTCRDRPVFPGAPPSWPSAHNTGTDRHFRPALLDPRARWHRRVPGCRSCWLLERMISAAEDHRVATVTASGGWLGKRRLQLCRLTAVAAARPRTLRIPLRAARGVRASRPARPGYAPRASRSRR